MLPFLLLSLSRSCASDFRCLFTSLQIPNQPTTFYYPGGQTTRQEDGLIAYTWASFFNDTANPYWLARMPMTKAAGRRFVAAIFLSLCRPGVSFFFFLSFVFVLVFLFLLPFPSSISGFSTIALRSIAIASLPTSAYLFQFAPSTRCRRSSRS